MLTKKTWLNIGWGDWLSDVELELISFYDGHRYKYSKFYIGGKWCSEETGEREAIVTGLLEYTGYFNDEIKEKLISEKEAAKAADWLLSHI